MRADAGSGRDRARAPRRRSATCGTAWERRRRARRLSEMGRRRRTPPHRLESTVMSYRSDLEARLAKKTTKAIVDYRMIDDGDRIMVGLSGGKDSWALLQILDVLRQRAPVRFSLVAVNVDSGYKEYKHDLIASTCIARGWEYRIEHTGIGQLIDDILDEGDTPCSLCARLRRGVLYRIAQERSEEHTSEL